MWQPGCKGSVCLARRKAKFGHGRSTPETLIGAVGVQKNLMGDDKDWVFQVFEVKSQRSVLVRYLGFSSNGGEWLRDSVVDPAFYYLLVGTVVVSVVLMDDPVRVFVDGFDGYDWTERTEESIDADYQRRQEEIDRIAKGCQEESELLQRCCDDLDDAMADAQEHN